jgi:hypothetical protein
VEQHTVTGLEVSGSGPPRAGQDRTADPACADEVTSDAVGEVLGVAVGHGQGDHLLGTVGADVGHDGVGHRFPGGVRAAGLMLPPVLLPGRLRLSGLPGPEEGQGPPVVGVGLPAVHRQRRRWHHPGGGTGGQLRSEAAGEDGLALAGVAHHPHLRRRGGGHRG